MPSNICLDILLVSILSYVSQPAYYKINLICCTASSFLINSSICLIAIQHVGSKNTLKMNFSLTYALFTKAVLVSDGRFECLFIPVRFIFCRTVIFLLMLRLVQSYLSPDKLLLRIKKYLVKFRAKCVWFTESITSVSPTVCFMLVTPSLLILARNRLYLVNCSDSCNASSLTCSRVLLSRLVANFF